MVVVIFIFLLLCFMDFFVLCVMSEYLLLSLLFFSMCFVKIGVVCLSGYMHWFFFVRYSGRFCYAFHFI